MIRIAPNYLRTDDDKEVSFEFTRTRAIDDLLSRYAMFDDPGVSASVDEVTISDGPFSIGLTSYKPGDIGDYDELRRISTLLQILTIAHNDKRGKDSLDDMDFGVVERTAAHQAGDRQTVVPTEESYASHKAILGFMIQWLLGREVAIPLETPDEVDASLGALEIELEGSGEKFEKMLADLLPA